MEKYSGFPRKPKVAAADDYSRNFTMKGDDVEILWTSYMPQGLTVKEIAAEAKRLRRAVDKDITVLKAQIKGSMKPEEDVHGVRNIGVSYTLKGNAKDARKLKDLLEKRGFVMTGSFVQHRKTKTEEWRKGRK